MGFWLRKKVSIIFTKCSYQTKRGKGVNIAPSDSGLSACFLSLISQGHPTLLLSNKHGFTLVLASALGKFHIVKGYKLGN